MFSKAAVGETEMVNGIYTKRTSDLNRLTEAGAATTCTSGITDMSKLFETKININNKILSYGIFRPQWGK